MWRLCASLLGIVAVAHAYYPFRTTASLAQRAYVIIDWSWHEVEQRVDFEITYKLNEADSAALNWLAFGFTPYGSNTDDLHGSDLCFVDTDGAVLVS